MAWSISVPHNERRLNGTLDFLNEGPNPAKVVLLNGDQPETGGPETTRLAVISLDKPCGIVEDGRLVLTSADAPLCLATGEATWARVFNGAGEFAQDGKVSTVEDGTGDVQIDDVNLRAGGRVQIVSAILT